MTPSPRDIKPGETVVVMLGDVPMNHDYTRPFPARADVVALREAGYEVTSNGCNMIVPMPVAKLTIQRTDVARAIYIARLRKTYSVYHMQQMVRNV